MRRFRRLTVGAGANAVIMGRRTWESIPARFRPLPERRNVVLSRAAALALPEGVHHARTWPEAVACAAGCEEVYVIGGGAIYALALADPRLTHVELTRIEGDFDCDTFLPPLAGFALVEASPPAGAGPLRHRFERWERPLDGRRPPG